jgi:predicted NBD/HSP70 family sugar kinase
MVAWVESQMASDYPHAAQLTAKRICELAREGDALALQAVEREGHYLGLGMANLVTLFAPDVIVLGGSVMKSVGNIAGADEHARAGGAGRARCGKIRIHQQDYDDRVRCEGCR